jgi:hypothetical protein
MHMYVHASRLGPLFDETPLPFTCGLSIAGGDREGGSGTDPQTRQTPTHTHGRGGMPVVFAGFGLGDLCGWIVGFGWKGHGGGGLLARENN